MLGYLPHSRPPLQEICEDENGRSYEVMQVPSVENSPKTPRSKRFREENSNSILSPSTARPRSRDVFFSEIANNFDSRMLGCVELRKRESIQTKMKNRLVLNDSENQALIHGLNSAAEKFVGNCALDPETSKMMANILRALLPETFNTREVIQTEYGPQPLNKGKGGNNLERRLANNYYNKILRPVISRETHTANSDSFAKFKKVRKIYGLKKEKWNIGASASKSALENAEYKVGLLVGADSIDEMKILVTEGAVYLQKVLSTEEPSKVVENLSGFFAGGPVLLQHWLGFMTEEEVNLISQAEEQTAKLSNLMENFLINKKEESFSSVLLESKKTSIERFGNESSHILFLIREVGKVLKDDPSKVLVYDGTEETVDSQLPNILITERRSLDRNTDYEYELILKVRIGVKVIYPSVSLPEAIASLISLFFIMNLEYPNMADNVLNLLQRYYLVFGTSEGSRNKRGKLKGTFIKFQVFLRYIGTVLFFIFQFRSLWEISC